MTVRPTLNALAEAIDAVIARDASPPQTEDIDRWDPIRQFLLDMCQTYLHAETMRAVVLGTGVITTAMLAENAVTAAAIADDAVQAAALNNADADMPATIRGFLEALPTRPLDERLSYNFLKDTPDIPPPYVLTRDGVWDALHSFVGAVFTRAALPQSPLTASWGTDWTSHGIAIPASGIARLSFTVGGATHYRLVDYADWRALTAATPGSAITPGTNALAFTVGSTTYYVGREGDDTMLYGASVSTASTVLAVETLSIPSGGGGASITDVLNALAGTSPAGVINVARVPTAIARQTAVDPLARNVRIDATTNNLQVAPANNPTTYANAGGKALPEAIRDVMGVALTEGNGITITVSDSDDTITIAASGGSSPATPTRSAALYSAITTTVRAPTASDFTTDATGNREASGNTIEMEGWQGNRQLHIAVPSSEGDITSIMQVGDPLNQEWIGSGNLYFAKRTGTVTIGADGAHNVWSTGGLLASTLFEPSGTDAEPEFRITQ